MNPSTFDIALALTSIITGSFVFGFALSAWAGARRRKRGFGDP